MRWFKSPTYDVHHYLKQATAQHQMAIDGLIEHGPFRVDALAIERFVTHLIVSLWDFPGSTAAWSLLSEVLDASRRTLAQVPVGLGPGDAATITLATGFRLSQQVAACTVSAQDLRATGSTHAWRYAEQALLPWLMLWGTGVDLPPYDIVYDAGPLKPSEKALYAGWLMPDSLLALMGHQQALRLWDFILADEPTTELHRMLGSEAQPNDRVDGLLEAISRALRDGTLQVNRLPAQAFAYLDRTFLVYPKAVELCFSAANRREVVLDRLMGKGLTDGLERVLVAPAGRESPIRLDGFWLRNADLGYVPNPMFKGTIEAVT